MVPLAEGEKSQEILFYTTETGLYPAHLGEAKIIFLLSGPTVVISSHPALISSQGSMKDVKLLASSQLQLYRP